MFYHTIHVILILVIFVTHVHSFVRILDRQKREEIRPRHPKEYVKCPHFICDAVDDYPKEHILEVMRNKKSLKSILGTILNNTLPTVLDNRFGSDIGEPKQLCRTVDPITHAPQVMRNVLLEWKYVINVEGYEQRFTSETCIKNDAATGGETNLKTDILRGVNFTCQQNYQQMYLLVFEDGFIDFDKFKIPTTCNSFCS